MTIKELVLGQANLNQMSSTLTHCKSVTANPLQSVRMDSHSVHTSHL